MQAEIYSITPFDAQIGTTIKYNWRSTQRSVKVKITDASGTTVYEDTIVTNVRQVIIPSSNVSNLTNGLDHSYIAYIQIQDANKDWSEVSNGMTFMCLATPTFSFSNLPTIDTNGTFTIAAYSYTFSVRYQQSDGERLASWSITLYSADGNRLSTSGVQTSVNHTSSGSGVVGTFSYPFSGFSDKRSYRIQAEGKTVNGLTVSTEYIGVSSDYSTSSVFALLNATNKPDEGKIHVASNVVSIVCKIFDPDGNEIPEDNLGNIGLLYSSDYTDPRTNNTVNGTHALILPDGYKMVLDEGFKIGGDYSTSLIFIDPVPNQPLFTLGKTNLYYRVGKFNSNWNESPTGEQACFELTVDGTPYVVYVSNVINRPASGSRVGVVIVREGSRYSLFASNNFRLKDGTQNPIESYARSGNGSVG